MNSRSITVQQNHIFISTNELLGDSGAVSEAELTVGRGDSPWPGSSGVCLQQPAGGQSMEEKV